MDSIELALDQLLNSMYVKSSLFIGIGRALGGLGALMYVFIRVWGHLARNEEIDITPLFRPVALALCLTFYGAIAGSVVKVSKEVGNGTKILVTSQVAEVNRLITVKQNLVKTRTTQLASALPAFDASKSGTNEWYMDKLFNNSVTNWVNEKATSALAGIIDDVLLTIGKVLYNTAGITIKFLQTFFMLVLLITGPITIGLACFEWFYGGLSAWVSRLIHLIMWLPLVNIIGGMLETIHIKMLEVDIAQINSTPSDVFTLTDTTMLAFYLLGSVSFLMVPTAASWVVESTGVGNAVRTAKGGFSSAGSMAGSAAGSAGGAAVGTASRAASLGKRMWNGI